MTNDRDIPDACRKLERYFEEIQDARSENYHKIYQSTYAQELSRYGPPE